MRILDYIRDIFVPGRSYGMTYATGIRDAKALALGLSDYAVEIAQDYLAGLVSRCTIHTYSLGKEIKDDEYYLWNIAPNSYETGPEFLGHITRQLLSQGEALVVEIGGYLYVAESYETSDAGLYPCVYSRVEIRRADGNTMTLAKYFTADDVLIFRLSDKYKTQMLRTIEAGYEALVEMAGNKYRRTAGRKGLLKVNRTASGNEEDKRKEREVIKKSFDKYYSDENALVILPNGMEYSELNGQTTTAGNNEISNTQALVKEALMAAARAYHIPPVLLLGEVADTSEALKMCLTSAVGPIVSILAAEINRKRYGKAVLKNSHVRISMSGIVQTNPFAVSTQADKLIASGIYSIDDIREQLGEEPLRTEWSRKHWMTLNYQDIEAAANTATGGKVKNGTE